MGITILAVVAWFLVGWLPSRLLKYIEYVRSYTYLGHDYWDRYDEVLLILLGLFGPIMLIITLVVMVEVRREEGWKLTQNWGWRW
jgi:hypothetical protein